MPRSLYLLALAVFVMGTSEFMLAGLLPALATDLGVTVGSAGLLTSAFAIGMVIGAPVMAAVARRWPPRTALLTCLLAFAACHVIGAITPVFPLILATRVLSALANAGFLAVALSSATALVPSNLKGRALAILLSGTTIATVAGVPAGSLLGTALGWRTTFWAIAVLCIPAAIGVARGIANTTGRTPTSSTATPPTPPKPTPTPPTPPPTPTQPPTTPTPAPTLRAELSQLATPRLVVTMTIGAVINGGTFAAFTFLAPVVTETAALSDGWVSITLMLFGIGSFLGVTIAGRLSDRHPGLVLAVGGPLLLAGWIVLALTAAQPSALLVMVFVQGILSFGVGSAVITRVLYAATDAPTMGGSYATAALNIGAAVGPALGASWLATGTGPLAPVWVASGLTAVALVIMVCSGRLLTNGGRTGSAV